MIKMDKIFYSACGVFALGIILSVLGFELGILFLVGAYLLRPTLHAFDLAPTYADERQVQIYSRSGNMAFIAVMIAAVGFSLARVARGEYADEMYQIIFIGIAARALVGLFMAGNLRRTGAIIIVAIGLILALFALASGGFSVPGLLVAGIGLGIAGLGFLSTKYPRIIALILSFAAIGAFLYLDLYKINSSSMALLVIVGLIFLAAICLVFSCRSEDDKPSNKAPRKARIIALAIATGICVFFFFIISYHPVGKQGREIFINRNIGGEITMLRINGRGPFDYHPNGQLESCTLAEETGIMEQILAEGTVVHFTAEGTLDWCFLQEDTEIQGHLCRGSGHGFMTGFHPNGQLRTSWLARDEIIQGVPCAKYAPITGGDATYFHDNGKLSFCTLSKDHTIGAVSFKKGDQIRMDQDGNLMNMEQ